MRDAYNDEVRRILLDKSTLPLSDVSRADAEASISDISKRLAGPLSNVERLWLVEDRQVLRNRLSKLSR